MTCEAEGQVGEGHFNFHPTEDTVFKVRSFRLDW